MGPSLGFLLANGVMLALSAGLTDAEFRAWGWRIPFWGRTRASSDVRGGGAATEREAPRATASRMPAASSRACGSPWSTSMSARPPA
ncbi:hypothetical protein A8W25_06560 [Streptomyces sp. ERV7]|nr:hypothetical protein A8W25_06560 [Streptomyces sp. ERV7]